MQMKHKNNGPFIVVILIEKTKFNNYYIPSSNQQKKIRPTYNETYDEMMMKPMMKLL